MIKDITINASPREGVGKGPTRRLRAQGMIPAAVYGEGGDALAVAVSAKEIATILRSGSGHNTIFKLALSQNDGEPANVIIKDYQIDPIKDSLGAAGFTDLRIAVLSLSKIIPDVPTYARALVLGNPLIDQYEHVAASTQLADALPRKFGTDPTRIPLQAIVFEAKRR